MSRQCTLLFKLEGPMQSWGYRSRFDSRDTAMEPTRSGVIGLICAAMGIARGESIERFDSIRMGVRVDKEGRQERDYHTALDVIKANGSGTDTVVSNRNYLADVSFTIGLESENRELLMEIADSLRNPKWFLYLGRKAFPLTVPPLGPSDSPSAGTLEEHLIKENSRKRTIVESLEGERTQQDWPLCFRERRFKPRSIKTTYGGKTA